MGGGSPSVWGWWSSSITGSHGWVQRWLKRPIRDLHARLQIWRTVPEERTGSWWHQDTALSLCLSCLLTSIVRSFLGKYFITRLWAGRQFLLLDAFCAIKDPWLKVHGCASWDKISTHILERSWIESTLFFSAFPIDHLWWAPGPRAGLCLGWTLNCRRSQGV